MSTPADPPSLNVSQLLGELMGKSGVIWVEVPSDRAYGVWHVWDGERALVVSGPGEQWLPWLPADVRVILRSKDSGGRLMTVRAAATVLEPRSPSWEQAVALLAPERLNGSSGQVQRWHDECTVTALQPYGSPVEQPGHLGELSGRAVRPASSATTAAWRPWHWKGRARRRAR